MFTRIDAIYSENLSIVLYESLYALLLSLI